MMLLINNILNKNSNTNKCCAYRIKNLHSNLYDINLINISIDDMNSSFQCSLLTKYIY